MNNQKEQWIMKSIRIEFNRYGEHAGRYTGSVEYANQERESFSFILRPDIAERYIALIAEDVVEGADNLGKRLKNSLAAQGLLGLDNNTQSDQN